MRLNAPAIQRLCGETEDDLLMHLVEQLHLLTDVAEDIHRTLVDEVPLDCVKGVDSNSIDEELTDTGVLRIKGMDGSPT